MYRPESKKGLYIVFILAIASIIGWAFLYFYRPVIIEASCSDIASNTSGVLSKRQYELDPNYSYDYLKTRCLEDAKYAKATK